MPVSTAGIDTLGAARLGEVVLDLSPKALAAQTRQVAFARPFTGWA